MTEIQDFCLTCVFCSFVSFSLKKTIEQKKQGERPGGPTNYIGGGK